MDDKRRIGHVARLLGVTPHYLRMLEWEGRIPEVGYDRVGRCYTEADVELLKAMGRQQASATPFGGRDSRGVAMSKASPMGITYAPCSPGATPEAELDALSAIYRCAIEHYEERQAASENGGEEDAKPDRRVEVAQPSGD